MPPTKRTPTKAPVGTPETPVATGSIISTSGPDPTTVSPEGITGPLARSGTVTDPRVAALADLRKPFPEEAIGKLPRNNCRACKDVAKQWRACERHTFVRACEHCGQSHTSATMHLDFVGHADLTARLLEVDPLWTWEPFTQEQIHALPPALQQAGLWINLTVLGVTRPGFGDAEGKSGGSAVKEMIGDALRNAGMRFGIALDLWAKGDRSWASTPDETPAPEQPAYTRDDGTGGSVHSGRVDELDALPGNELPEVEKRRWDMHLRAWQDDYAQLTPEQQAIVQQNWPAGAPTPQSGRMSINELKASRATFGTFPPAQPQQQQELPNP